MKRIQVIYDMPAPVWPQADFVIRVQPLTRIPDEGLSPLDVHGFSSCWQRGPGLPPRTTELPHWLEKDIRAAAEYPCRLLMGNDAVELLFHHVCSIDAKANVAATLKWADWCWSLVGEKLVLAPMFLGLVFDYAQGSPFMGWLAAHKVPMILFSGWRVLLDPKSLTGKHALEVQGHDQFCDYDWHPHRYPYRELSDAIRETGVEVWTGAGYAEGLKRGTLLLAEEFGMAGVLTTKDAWEEAG